jgi:hypothetical protein
MVETTRNKQNERRYALVSDCGERSLNHIKNDSLLLKREGIKK